MAPRPDTPDDAFSDLATGTANVVAMGACRAAASRREAWTSDHVWVHGAVGSGKSALLRAVAIHGGGTYRACEEWANHWIQALKEGDVRHEHLPFTVPKALHVFDDVDFLSGRPRIQHEFEMALERTRMAGGRVIMAARVRPMAMPDLGDRLRAMLQQAFVVGLDRPGPDLATGVARVAARRAGLELSDAALACFARRRWTNVREVVGAATMVAAHVLLGKVDQVAAAAEAVRPRWVRPSPEEVLAKVAQAFGVSMTAMTSSSRRVDVALARHVAMSLMKEACEFSICEVGRVMGLDHTTVIYGIRRVDSRRGMEPWHVKAMDQVRDLVMRPM